MLNNDQVLALYETLSQISAQMLTAARAHDWEELDALGTRYVRETETIKAETPCDALTRVQRLKKGQIIREILDNDRAIRDITQPWMRELQALMNQVGTQRKLQQAYGSGLF